MEPGAQTSSDDQMKSDLRLLKNEITNLAGVIPDFG